MHRAEPNNTVRNFKMECPCKKKGEEISMATLDYDKIINGIRKALYGYEVREYIAKAMEWVKSCMETSVETITGLRDEANAAKDAAKASQDAAKTSETNAKASVATCTAKAKEAEASAGKAAASEEAAAKSEAAAQASKEAAAKSESASADSADKAKAEADRAAQITTNTFIYAYDLTLSPSGWTECSDEAATAAGLAYQYDAALADCTDRLEPSATVAMVSIPAAQKAGLGAVCESRAGAVRFWAAKLPEAEISLRLLLTNRTGEEAS